MSTRSWCNWQACGRPIVSVLCLVAMLGVSRSVAAQPEGAQEQSSGIARRATVEELGFRLLEDGSGYEWRAQVRNQSSDHIDVVVDFELVDLGGGVIDSDSLTVRMGPGSERVVTKEKPWAAGKPAGEPTLGARASLQWRPAGVFASRTLIVPPGEDARRPAVALQLDVDSQTVTITNQRTQEISLLGWVLVNGRSGSRLVFAQVSLPAGAVLTIAAGPGTPEQSPHLLRWTGSNVWQEGDVVELYDQRDLLVAIGR